MIIYLDSGDIEAMLRWGHHVQGFTTNPTLAKKVGVMDYRHFGKAAITAANGKPISLEVLADDFGTMEAQARDIATWADNVYVKIPITNTQGESSLPLMRRLGMKGIKVNATAIVSLDQIEAAARTLTLAPSILSVFAGRIADTGRDPTPFIIKAQHAKSSMTKLLWASAREVFNIAQAQALSCDIITVSPDLLKKHIAMNGKDLNALSLQTVQQFYEDAQGMKL